MADTANRVIKISSLSPKEFGKAIRKLERYKNTLQNRVDSLVAALTERGVKVAKINVVQLGAFDSGILEGSIQGYFSQSLHAGIIYTNCYYAVFVEFGTGARASEASHPKAGELGYAYDVNGHGEDGWFFYNNETGKSGWTTGMPSRPFMYDMTIQLRAECEKMARRYMRSR